MFLKLSYNFLVFSVITFESLFLPFPPAPPGVSDCGGHSGGGFLSGKAQLGFILWIKDKDPGYWLLCLGLPM